jgi:hypothetical protein
MSKVLIFTGFSQSSSNNRTAAAYRIIRGTRKYEYLKVYNGMPDPDETELEIIYESLKYLMEDLDSEVEKKVVIYSWNINAVKLLRKYLSEQDNDFSEISTLVGKIYSLEREKGQFKFKYISKELEEKPNDDVCDLAFRGASGRIEGYREVYFIRKRSKRTDKYRRKRLRKKGRTGKSTPHGVRR